MTSIHILVVDHTQVLSRASKCESKKQEQETKNIKKHKLKRLRP